MVLSEVKKNGVYHVKHLDGSDDLNRHLENLGFVPGESVTVVSRIAGNVIVNVKGSRVALSSYLGVCFSLLILKGGRVKTLRDVRTGETVQVVKLHGEGAVKRRIMDMGVTKGCTIFVRKVAPLGDPVEVTIRGYELSIRKGDAELIEVS